MSQVIRQRQIAAPPDTVWQVLADFDRIADWAPNVDHSCLLTEQDSGEGVVRRVQVGRMVLTETIQSWQPGSSLSYAISGLPPVIRSVVNTWRLEPQAGGTLVTLTTDVDAGGRPPQQLVARVVGRKLASASDEMLDGLTAHIDRQERSS